MGAALPKMKFDSISLAKWAAWRTQEEGHSLFFHTSVTVTETAAIRKRENETRLLLFACSIRKLYIALTSTSLTVLFQSIVNQI